MPNTLCLHSIVIQSNSLLILHHLQTLVQHLSRSASESISKPTTNPEPTVVQKLIEDTRITEYHIPFPRETDAKTTFVYLSRVRQYRKLNRHISDIRIYEEIISKIPHKYLHSYTSYFDELQNELMTSAAPDSLRVDQFDTVAAFTQACERKLQTIDTYSKWLLQLHPPNWTSYDFHSLFTSIQIRKNENPAQCINRIMGYFDECDDIIDLLNTCEKDPNNKLQKIPDHQRLYTLKRVFIHDNNSSRLRNDGKLNLKMKTKLQIALNKLKPEERDQIKPFCKLITEHRDIIVPPHNRDDNVESLHWHNYHDATQYYSVFTFTASHRTGSYLRNKRKRDNDDDPNPNARKRSRANIPCKFGQKCNKRANGTCEFKHSKLKRPCKNGPRCPQLRDGTCKFYHHKHYQQQQRQQQQQQQSKHGCINGERCRNWQKGTCKNKHDPKHMRCAHCNKPGHPKHKCYHLLNEQQRNGQPLSFKTGKDNTNNAIPRYNPTHQLNAEDSLREINKHKNKVHWKQQQTAHLLQTGLGAFNTGIQLMNQAMSSNTNTPPTTIDQKPCPNYPPKKAVHLWNFAKEEKMVVVKYKEARIAFDRIFSEYKKTQNDSNIEGYRTRSDTDLGLKCSQNKDILRLRINKYTTSDDIERIRVSFLECLESYRKQILHDPVSPLHLFNFINEDMAYSVRYADVKSAYRFAVKHQWFKPKKRMKKVHKRAREVEGSDETETQGEYVLEEVIKEAKETKKEAVIVIQDAMDDAVFDTLLVKYQMEYQNPPRNASQIMNFAKECGELFKYKACRIAFHRWQHARGSRMPQMELEPGNNGNDRE